MMFLDISFSASGRKQTLVGEVGTRKYGGQFAYFARK